MNQKITTFLMFYGNAEAAMNFYMSLFEDSKVLGVKYYDADGPGKEGSVMHAVFMLNKQEFMCIDSNVEHGFTFTPAMSLYVTCKTEEEIDRLYRELSEGGRVFMPLQAYPFNRRYGWVEDKFGVSWQLAME